MLGIPGGTELLIIVGAIIFLFGKDKAMNWYRSFREISDETVSGDESS